MAARTASLPAREGSPSLLPVELQVWSPRHLGFEELHQDLLILRPVPPLADVVHDEGVAGVGQIEITTVAAHAKPSADDFFAEIGKTGDARVIADDAALNPRAGFDEAVAADHARSNDSRAGLDLRTRADEYRRDNLRVVEIEPQVDPGPDT